MNAKNLFVLGLAAALLSCTGCGPGPSGTMNRGPVYQADFKGEVGSEWNHQTISRTKKGDRPYLGDFFQGSKPTLTLASLPPHRLVRVTFDLFLFKSWDGSSPIWGPGLFDARVGGQDGRSLLHATFSNCGFFRDNNEQSFPDNYPARPYGAWTLATEKQSLGAMMDWGGPARTFDSSGVYHMVFTFPHTEAKISLEFDSTLPESSKKPFGLTNFKLEVLPELVKFTAQEMDQLWKDLGNPDPKMFWEARWKLVSAGDATTEYIGKHYGDLKIPANLPLRNPGGNAKPYPLHFAAIHSERARWVLEAIHTPAAMDLKKGIPTLAD
jgi:hypothetical protein